MGPQRDQSELWVPKVCPWGTESGPRGRKSDPREGPNAPWGLGKTIKRAAIHTHITIHTYIEHRVRRPLARGKKPQGAARGKRRRREEKGREGEREVAEGRDPVHNRRAMKSAPGNPGGVGGDPEGFTIIIIILLLYTSIY